MDGDREVMGAAASAVVVAMMGVGVEAEVAAGVAAEVDSVSVGAGAGAGAGADEVKGPMANPTAIKRGPTKQAMGSTPTPISCSMSMASR